MSSRERNLLIIFLVALAAVALLVGLSNYLESISRLDSEFIELQKHALRLTQASVNAQDPSNVSSWGNLKERFFAQGTLQDPLALASRVQSALKASDIVVLESKVVENSGSSQWVQYRAEGAIESWFRFLQLLRSQDSKSLFRSVSLVRKQGFLYSIAFEVGHAVIQ